MSLPHQQGDTMLMFPRNPTSRDGMEISIITDGNETKENQMCWSDHMAFIFISFLYCLQELFYNFKSKIV